jgi:hypothetical protein
VFRRVEPLLAHPRLRWCWRFAAVLAIARIVLIGTFIVDPRFGLGALAEDPFYRSHSCLTAYWRAGALAKQGGVDIYDPELYDGKIDGFDVDPYVYPPPFLLWPSAAALFTARFAPIRTAWFVVELAMFVWAFGSVAAWIGGRRGARCILWAPLVVTGLPVLLGLQMGNFHLAAVALAMLGMLAAEKEQPIRAGLGLALATSAKIFPGILLVVLLARRKPRPVLFTLAWLVVFTGATVALFGTAPLNAFLDAPLRRMVALDADHWERPELFGTVNSSVFGLALKIRALGVPIVPGLATLLAMLYGVGLLTVAIGAGRTASSTDTTLSSSPPEEDGRDEESRLFEAQTWLAFLTLASLRAPFAPDAYAGAPAIWLLALVAASARRPRNAWLAVLFLLLWIVLPSRTAAPRIEGFRLPFSLAAQLAILGLAGTIAWDAFRRSSHRRPA